MPDISVFCFHFWQEVEYYNPLAKQPSDGWTPGRFLGIAWDSGDYMTYYIETKNKNNCPVVLVRSTVQPKLHDDEFRVSPSGENTTLTDNDHIRQKDDTNDLNAINEIEDGEGQILNLKKSD